MTMRSVTPPRIHRFIFPVSSAEEEDRSHVVVSRFTVYSIYEGNVRREIVG